MPGAWKYVYALNPMVGVIDGFRWAILGGETALDPAAFGLSLAVIAFFLWLGLRQFRRMEHGFADLI